jgi:hypothetical protein
VQERKRYANIREPMKPPFRPAESPNTTTARRS